MRFTLTKEQHAFADTLHELLSAAGTPAIGRAWAGGDHAPGRALWGELADLGVWGLLVPEEHGGLGATPVDAVVAWEALGYHGVPGPVVETLGVAPRLLAGDGEVLAGIAAGELIATAALPPAVPRALDADVADVLLRSDGVTVERCEPGAPEPETSIDPTRRLVAVPAGGTAVAAPQAGAFEHGVLGVSAQLVGAARRMLDLATEYAAQRSQYGRVIGSYQSVKHLLADVAMRVEMARPVVYGAAVICGEPGGAGSVSPAVVRETSAAKVAATRTALLAARTALQVHGAVGYTAEHDLGLWLTKARALAGAWGTADDHRRRVLATLTGGPAGSGGADVA
ncbi:hypothetical protein BJF85_23865 [Saccharomonospora sp. CUA-673]|uniref:acyl-CoA dehydrogenase family protein n=1 Tax=Saccharomonospora sp. CUA-673 TaxID=1904969 RepID=UPI00095DF25C|nr:acyl-CoA dehydrogenase family protein [Saccharomonospora sp. CUA-673]OLT41373.1 hypothetical protein BJF85_23865 [Saccharomonospora sp. CUA-673]